jgi:NAD(P)-dependent dehydrogenase (short-subunit alcohol dehydrogenase family)
MRFSGKTVLVTGAARGIGRTVATAFAGEGARVFGMDIAQGERQPGVTMLHGDVADEAQVRAVLEQVGPELHVLINNAGLPQFGPLESTPVAEFDRILAVNLRGPYLMSRFAAPLMRAAGQGAIINIASTRAIMSEPGGEAYGASKGGLVALTHALANSLGPAIRVNAIMAGWINTGSETELSEEDHAQHPVGRAGRTEDIAQACLFLASPEQAGFITGESLVIDGGMTRKMIYLEEP